MRQGSECERNGTTTSSNWFTVPDSPTGSKLCIQVCEVSREDSPEPSG
jgi:hypothetical protein